MRSKLIGPAGPAPLVWLLVLLGRPVPRSGFRLPSSQKPARRPPPRSSVPRKPMRLVESPPFDSALTAPPPSPFVYWTPRSITPNTVTLDCACAAPLLARPMAEHIKSLFMVACLLL